MESLAFRAHNSGLAQFGSDLAFRGVGGADFSWRGMLRRASGEVMKRAFRRGDLTSSVGLTKEESCSSRFEQSARKAWRLRRRPMFGIDVVCSMISRAIDAIPHVQASKGRVREVMRSVECKR